MTDTMLDARQLPLYHCVSVSPKEAYIVSIYQANDGKIHKVWKKYDPSLDLKSEEYVLHEPNKVSHENDAKPNHYILDTSELKIVAKDTAEGKKGNNLSRYQHFIKAKTEELTHSYPNMTKKERYNLALEEWRKTK